jgi:hypothetical protein
MPPYVPSTYSLASSIAMLLEIAAWVVLFLFLTHFYNPLYLCSFPNHSTKISLNISNVLCCSIARAFLLLLTGHIHGIWPCGCILLGKLFIWPSPTYHLAFSSIISYSKMTFLDHSKSRKEIAPILFHNVEAVTNAYSPTHLFSLYACCLAHYAHSRHDFSSFHFISSKETFSGVSRRRIYCYDSKLHLGSKGRKCCQALGNWEWEETAAGSKTIYLGCTLPLGVK